MAITLRSNLLMAVLVISLFSYFFSAAGYVDTIDANPSIETARALISERSLTFKSKEEWPTVFSKNNSRTGSYVSKMGLAMPTLYLAPVAIASFFSNDPGAQRTIANFLVSLVNGVLAAIILGLSFLILNHLGWGTRRSLLLVFLLGFASMLWPYAKTCHREILQALALLGILWATFEKKPGVAGSFFAIGLLTKVAWVVPALPLLFWSFRSFKKSKQGLFPLVLMISLGFALYFSHAWYFWGSPLGTGYGSGTMSPTGSFWSTPFLSGLHAQLTSWKTGIFAFNPLLLFLIPVLFLKIKTRSFSALQIAVLSSIGLQICLYSRWLNPLGGHNLGPRYLVVVLPLFFLIPDPRSLDFLKFRMVKGLAVFILVYSFVLQGAFVCVKAQELHTLGAASAFPLQEAPWLTQIKLFTHKLRGEPEIYNLKTFGGEDLWVDLTSHRSFHGFNFWWAHLRRHLNADPKKNLNARLSPAG